MKRKSQCDFKFYDVKYILVKEESSHSGGINEWNKFSEINPVMVGYIHTTMWLIL